MKSVLVMRMAPATWPLAVRRPLIWVGSLLLTRLSSAAWLLGWLMLTAALLPMLKPCQLTTACWLPCVICMLVPDWLMATWPAATWPPVGSWLAAGGVGG